MIYFFHQALYLLPCQAIHTESDYLPVPVENEEIHLGGDPNMPDVGESHEGEFTRAARAQFVAPNGSLDDSFVLVLVQNQILPFSETVQPEHNLAQKQNNQQAHIARQTTKYSDEDYRRHWKM